MRGCCHCTVSEPLDTSVQASLSHRGVKEMSMKLMNIVRCYAIPLQILSHHLVLWLHSPLSPSSFKPTSLFGCCISVPAVASRDMLTGFDQGFVISSQPSRLESWNTMTCKMIRPDSLSSYCSIGISRIVFASLTWGWKICHVIMLFVTQCVPWAKWDC